MTTLTWRRVARIAWGLVLSLISPGFGLVYARLVWAGIVLLVVDEAIALGFLTITRYHAPAAEPLAWFLALLGVALLLRLVAMWIVARRLRVPRLPVRWFRSTWALSLVVLAIGIGVDSVTPAVGWRAFSIPSGSMAPTLQVGDLMLADVRTPGERPVPGAVIVFGVPDPEGTIYVKRVIGLPGDAVTVRTGHVIINNRPTGLRAEPSVQTDEGEARRYVETLPSGQSFVMQKLSNDGPMNDTPLFVVPPGNLFVMGDNRDNSLDSRSLGLRQGGAFGYVPFPNVLGTAALIYWPPSRAFTPMAVR